MEISHCHFFRRKPDTKGQETLAVTQHFPQKQGHRSYVHVNWEWFLSRLHHYYKTASIVVPARRNCHNGKLGRKLSLTKPPERCRTLLTRTNMQLITTLIINALGKSTCTPQSYFQACQSFAGHHIPSWAPVQALKHGRVSNQRSQRSRRHSPLIRMFKVASRLRDTLLPLHFDRGSTKNSLRSLCP